MENNEDLKGCGMAIGIVAILLVFGGLVAILQGDPPWRWNETKRTPERVAPTKDWGVSPVRPTSLPRIGSRPTQADHERWNDCVSAGGRWDSAGMVCYGSAGSGAQIYPTPSSGEHSDWHDCMLSGGRWNDTDSFCQ